MPGFDRTGPVGLGPRTGGGFGRCGPGPARYTGRLTRGVGRGGFPWGGGRGRAWGGGCRFGAGFGFRSDYTASLYDARTEASWLKEEAAVLEQELAHIKQRLAALEERKETE